MALPQILIVDGDVRSRRVIEVSLSKAGYSIVLADSAEHAIELLAHAEPDLIISEARLPGRDGYELFVQIRDHARWRSIPFVFLTSEKSIESKLRGLELGAEDYWVKPVFIKEVTTRIARLLERRPQERLATNDAARVPPSNRTTVSDNARELEAARELRGQRAEFRLSILHISDLHARSLDVDELPKKARDGRVNRVRREAASRARVLGDAWRDNLRMLYPEGERPDLVCFTGDVADWGLASEYAVATMVVDDLVRTLGIGRSRVYVVPGNHDVQRYEARDAWSEVRGLMDTESAVVSRWLAGDDPPRKVEPAVADAVMRRTAAFWDWVELGLRRPELRPAESPHRRLGYHHMPALGLPFEVHVMGLDSAWLAGDDHDQGKLWLTQHQRDMLLHDEQGRPWPGFRLALVHHPLEDLAQPDVGPSRRDLAAAADLLLHGHQHSAAGSNLVDLDGNALRVLAAGCLYEGTSGNTWKNGCQRIDVVLDEQGRPQRAEIHFRAWSSHGHWYSDSSLYKGLRDGRMVWDAWERDGGPAPSPGAVEEKGERAKPVRQRAGWEAWTGDGVAPADAAPPKRDATPTGHSPSDARMSGSLGGDSPREVVDNRGATVNQQIIVHGAATFGPMNVGLPGASPTRPQDTGTTEPQTARGQATVGEESDAIATRLADAYARRDELTSIGEDTSEVVGEILDLRRTLRQGPTLHAGEFLGDGRFQLVKVIGQGGFATVWKAKDRSTGQHVAVKVLHGQFVHSLERRERLFRGASRMAQLDHPNIVKVLVPKGEEQGFYYYVMEYVAGGDLHQAVLARRFGQDQLLTAITSIASALEAAHAQGLVHRDVKPQNILLHEDGRPVLSDFDLVQAKDTTGGTRTGALGTMLYAAPEQSEDARKVDHRADVYSLGMTAMFCIHGDKLPQAAMFGRAEFLRQLPCSDEIRQVLAKAVALEVGDRFESMAGLRLALEQARRPAAIVRADVEEDEVEVSRPAVSRRTVALGAAVGVVGLAYWLWPQGGRGSTETTPESKAMQTKDPASTVGEATAAVVVQSSDDDDIWGELRFTTKAVKGVELVLVPAGKFQMGSPTDEEGRFDDEGPQHEVELATFWLARAPVTNEQYGEYLRAKPKAAKPKYWDDPRFNQPKQPVVGVSWTEAKAYCDWAGLQLPTEAQWEYACRAGTTTRYWSGDKEEALARVGWYAGNSGGALHPARQKPYNDFGLFDMHGNAYQWCEDTWVPSYQGAVHRPGDGLRVQPVGDAARVMRGGYFDYEARDARSADRYGDHPGDRWVNLGFRPAQGHP